MGEVHMSSPASDRCPFMRSVLPELGNVSKCNTSGDAHTPGNALSGNKSPLTPSMTSRSKPVKSAATRMESSLSLREGRLMVKVFSNCDESGKSLSKRAQGVPQASDCSAAPASVLSAFSGRPIVLSHRVSLSREQAGTGRDS